MKMKKKIIATLLAALTVASSISMTSCGNTDNGGSGDNGSSADKKYVVGICQLAVHPALDAATAGFKEALTEKLGDKVDFKEQNAAGDANTCNTICTQLVSDKVDLILANATGALQAASAATSEIPIIGTSVTDYATALAISDWTGKTGKNITGTSDLAPLDEQANAVAELFPASENKNLGIIYCSGEPNSLYQVNTITPMFEKLGYTVTPFSFSDSNDVAAVTQSACSNSDVIYIPTDNTAASCTEAIRNVAVPAKTPIFAGEENICKGCGVATLSISYHDIGYKAGEMAYEILVNGADITTMEIATAAKFTKEYNKSVADELGFTAPADYTPIAD